MRYELALELKKAGFPQHLDKVICSEDATDLGSRDFGLAIEYKRGVHKTFDLSALGYPKTLPDYYEQGKWRSSIIFSKQFLKSPDSETVYFPTLEELIENVVGDKPNSFYLEYNDNWCVYENPDPRGKWMARYYEITPIGFYKVFDSTPLEAVACLWIALNKQKNG